MVYTIEIPFNRHLFQNISFSFFAFLTYYCQNLIVYILISVRIQQHSTEVYSIIYLKHLKNSVILIICDTVNIQPKYKVLKQFYWEEIEVKHSVFWLTDRHLDLDLCNLKMVKVLSY